MRDESVCGYACVGNVDVETLKQELSYTSANSNWDAVGMVAEAVGCWHPFLMMSMLQSLPVCQAVADVLHELAPAKPRPVEASALHKAAAAKIEHFLSVSFFKRLSQVAERSNAAFKATAASETFGNFSKPNFLAQDLQNYNAYADLHCSVARILPPCACVYESER